MRERFALVAVVSAALLTAEGSIHAQDGAHLGVQTGHKDYITAVAISDDARYVLTGSTDGVAILWDVASGRQLRSIRVGTSIRAVQMSDDARFAVSASTNAVLWDLRTGEEARGQSISSNLASGTMISMTPDARFLLVAKESGEYEADPKVALHWLYPDDPVKRAARVAPGVPPPPPPADMPFFEDNRAETIDGIALTPDARLAAVVVGQRGAANEEIRIWDPAHLKLLRRFQAPSRGILSVALTPDGSRLLLQPEHDAAEVWNTVTGQRIYSLGKSPDYSDHAPLTTARDGGRAVDCRHPV